MDEHVTPASRDSNQGTSPAAPGASAPVAAPVKQAERIMAIDVLRGFALLGILVMNIRFFASVMASYSNPTVYVDGTGANWWVFVGAHVLADLKMMAIFSMLFGAGIVLMTARQDAKGLGTAGVHYRRMLWLLLFGLVHAYLIWMGDILVMYALCGFIVFLARRWPAVVQLILGGVLLLVGLGINLASGLTIEFWPPEQVEAMRSMWAPGEERIRTELEAFGGSPAERIPFQIQESIGWQTMGFVFFGFWRAGGLMLLGMGLFKLGVFSANRSNGFYAALIGAALLVGVPLILFGLQRNVQANWTMEQSMFINSSFNYVGSLFVALGWVGAIMLVVKAGALAWLTSALSAVGQMAFTNYIMQSVLCTTIFYGHGFGLFGELDYLEQFYVVLGVWVLELLWSPWWLKRYRFGPLEWAWRSLTYWRRQPMRRATAPA